jgi:hypothetical protein
MVTESDDELATSPPAAVSQKLSLNSDSESFNFGSDGSDNEAPPSRNHENNNEPPRYGSENHENIERQGSDDLSDFGDFDNQP